MTSSWASGKHFSLFLSDFISQILARTIYQLIMSIYFLMSSLHFWDMLSLWSIWTIYLFRFYYPPWSWSEFFNSGLAFFALIYSHTYLEIFKCGAARMNLCVITFSKVYNQDKRGKRGVWFIFVWFCGCLLLCSLPFFDSSSYNVGKQRVWTGEPGAILHTDLVQRSFKYNHNAIYLCEQKHGGSIRSWLD